MGRGMIAKAMIVAVLAGGGVAAASGVALAQPIKGGTGGGGCDVVHHDDNGNVVRIEKVPVGTRSGLFYCGSDGEWHFGTVVLDWRTADDTQPPFPGPVGPKPVAVAQR